MPETTRQLAAIMFTDIVGYTKMMGKDEDKALDVLRVNREIHAELIKSHNGSLIKEMGDGNLIHFNSSIEAVQCAIEIHKRATEELEAKIRIGIHLGDITLEGNDVFGDGVNIASRLQSIADPGGVYISESIQKSIRAKSDILTTYLGEFNLKNVDYLVKTYAIKGNGLPVPPQDKIERLTGKGKEKLFIRSRVTYLLVFLILIISILWFKNPFKNPDPGISSLVFLPFKNYTGSDTLEYMMAGMHDALIGEVGKISSLRIPGTRTANAYKDVEKTIPEIASELKVDAGVETSVSCYGDKICFQVKIVNAFPEEKQLWIKDYTVDKSQIHNWYKKLAIEVSHEINIHLTKKEEFLLVSADSISPVAYELYMKGKFYLNQINPTSLNSAAELFSRAIEKEPNWSFPYVGLASVGAYQKQMGFAHDSVVLPLIQQNLQKALELDSSSANAHYISAVTAVWTEFNWGKGEKEFLKSIEMNPNNAYARILYAHLLMILRRTDEAIIEARFAESLEPLDPFIQGLYADVMKRAGYCEVAKAHALKGLAIEPAHYFALSELMAAYICLEEYDKAYEMRKHNPLRKYWGVTDQMDTIFANHGWDALMKAEINLNEQYKIKGHGFVFQFNRYLAIGNHERAIDCMEALYEQRNPNIPYFSAIDHYSVLKSYPRYIALLEKMNLPLD